VRAVPVGAVGVRTDTRKVFGENPQRVGRDANATLRRRCVVTAHGKAMAGSWRGKVGGAARSEGRHWPCSRCGCALPREGSGLPDSRRGRAVREAPAFRARGTTRQRGATAFAGARWRRGGLLHEKTARRPKGKGVPRVCYRRLLGIAGSRGEGKGTAAVALTEGSLAGHLARWWAGAGGPGPCRMSGGVEVVVRGAGLVKLQWRRRRRPPRSAPGPPPLALLLLLLLSLSLVW
jgi:hypothetical protein